MPCLWSGLANTAHFTPGSVIISPEQRSLMRPQTLKQFPARGRSPFWGACLKENPVLFRFRNRQNSAQLPARIPLAPGSSSPPGPGSAYSGTTSSPMPRPLRARDARVTAPWSKRHYLTSPEEPKAQRTAAISLKSASKWGTGALDLTLFAMDIQPKTATAKLWLKQKWNFFSRVPFIPDDSTRFENESCMVVSGNFQKNLKLDFSWLLIPL